MRLINVRYLVEEERSYMDVVGIDVSKADFHAYLIQGDRRARKSFPNTAAGYRQFLRWLDNRHARAVHVCMEATGGYWDDLAQSIFDRGVRVSVVPPSRTTLYARSQLRRTKTDAVDAAMIAEFCLTQNPPSWEPPAREVRELRKLLDYRTHLVDERTRFRQLGTDLKLHGRLATLQDAQLDTIDEMIREIESEIEAAIKAHEGFRRSVDRLVEIKGIGLVTAATLVATLPVNRLRNAKAAAAYAGLTPREKQSGTSVHGRPRLCKTGNASLRRSLYMPALVAMRLNPILADFAQRLSQSGKAKRLIIAAIMRKLVVLAFRLIKESTINAPIVV